jgi:hypothetical protein
MKRLAALVLLPVTIAAVACGRSKPATAPPPGLTVQPLASDASAPPPTPSGPSVERSHLVGTIASKAIGPFIGRSGNGGLVAWIAPAERGGGQELAVVPVAQDGAPFGQPRVAASVPQEATSLVLRPTGTAHGGWLAAWSALLDRGESLSVLGIGSDGSSQKVAFDLTRTTDHVKWMDIVPLPSGGMCIWAEETPAGDANILAAPLDTDGKARGLPVRVARGMIGWAVARDGDGAALALVQRAAEGSNGGGALTWLRLDGDAHARGAPIPIGNRATVSGDVDLVAIPGGWLLGWTDRMSEDAQVMLATIDTSGKVTGPRRAMDAIGGAALVALASGPAGVALAWSEPRGRARAMRSLHLAGVALDGPTAQPVTSVDVASGGAAELVATDGGFALLSTAQACALDDGAACNGDLVPSVIRFDGRLVATQTEPLFVGDKRTPATLGWNLGCLGDRCITLAADAASPTGVFAVDLALRSSPFRAPITPPLPVDAPRVVGIVTVASGQPYADLATVRVGDATLVATLTTALETVDEHARGNHAQAAVVALRAFDGDGQPLGPATTLTSRALPVGGVAIAPGARPDDGEAIAWVARDDGDPQVHVAHVDRRGRRTNEVQLTTTKGDASDVAIAWAGDGWMVAWVDARDGNGEVYATKVDRDLQRTAREERITHAPGDAGDVTLAVRGDVAWLAWSDPRESPHDGLSDIYATTLHVTNARRAGDEVRVLATASHSRSPVLAIAGDGAFVGWIEDAPPSLDAHGTAVVARLDTSAHVVGAAVPLPLADQGNPASIILVPDADGARAFVARSHRDEVSLDAVALRADGSPVPPAWRLLDLDAPATFEVSLAAAGDAIYFDDIGLTQADHRVRRAAVVWRR